MTGSSPEHHVDRLGHRLGDRSCNSAMAAKRRLKFKSKTNEIQKDRKGFSFAGDACKLLERVRAFGTNMSNRAGFASLAGGLTLVSAMVAGGGSADAQQIGNAGEGRRLAQADCAQCHRIDRNSYSSNFAAPTFDDIANVSGMTKTALIVALQTSHRLMPNLVIEGRDAEDLVAYILSLKRN